MKKQVKGILLPTDKVQFNSDCINYVTESCSEVCKGCECKKYEKVDPIEEAANNYYLKCDIPGVPRNIISHFKAGWKANPNQFTLEQMLEAITYGFQYHRDSMHDDIDVPNGNKLQWILGKYIDPLKHKEFIEKHNIK